MYRSGVSSTFADHRKSTLCANHCVLTLNRKRTRIAELANRQTNLQAAQRSAWKLIVRQIGMCDIFSASESIVSLEVPMEARSSSGWQSIVFRSQGTKGRRISRRQSGHGLQGAASHTVSVCGQPYPADTMFLFPFAGLSRSLLRLPQFAFRHRVPHSMEGTLYSIQYTF